MTGVARRPVAERLRRWLIAKCAPISIDGQTVQGITIDGQNVTEVTMDGQTVFNGGPPSSVIDNFEDDPDGIYTSGETTADYYSGSPAVFDRTTTNVTEGSQALKHDGSSGITAMYSTPGDGLNNYPSEGDTIEWIHYTDSAVVAGPVVAASAGVDGYLYDLHPGADEIQIWRFDNGSVTNIASTSQSITAGQFYFCEGRVPSSGDDTLLVEMYNINTSDNSRGSLINSTTTNDSNYVGQGVGWGVVSTGDGTFADALSIK